MKHKLLWAAIPILLAALLASAALASPGAVLTADTDAARVSPGGTVTVEITAAEAVADIAAWEARVYYDPACFTYLSGSLSYGIYCDPTVQADGIGTYLTLSLIDRAGASSIAAGGIGTVSFAARASADGASARFGVAQAAYYSAGGVRSGLGPVSWSQSVRIREAVIVPPGDIPGDANNDKTADRYDAALTLQWIVGLVEDDEIDLTMTDVDHSGGTDAADAAWMLHAADVEVPDVPPPDNVDGVSEGATSAENISENAQPSDEVADEDEIFDTEEDRKPMENDDPLPGEAEEAIVSEENTEQSQEERSDEDDPNTSDPTF